MGIQAINSFRPNNYLNNSRKINYVSQPLKADSVSFSRQYKGYTGWLEIPSCSKDGEGYSDNVDCLHHFWNNGWGEVSSIASDLWEGDFHIYMDNGTPQIGVKYLDKYGKDKDVVCDICFDRNTSCMPIKYIDIVKKHIKEQKSLENVDKIIEKSERLKENADNLFVNGAENYTVEEKLNAFGIKTVTDKKGKLILSEYRQPAQGIKFEDIGIDEDELLQKVSKIEGNADFTNSDATSLGSVKVINGNIILVNHNIKDMGELAHITGERICDNSDYHVAFEVKYEIW